jgi:superfamily II DNA/RNA helicase
MSCNSTYLLDPKTDYGVKTDEATSLLGEILEDPEAKVVVFSQWLRTHELLAGRLESRRWKYVLFHGGVPGPKRGEIIRRFREDPACRIFLSTDAGGVGLNLQSATAVVIMDQPWNPAVLEQRIGRVHRLGQRRPVRVVHFVSHGTIEHGMLEVLKFKRSMFAGVLDGGEDEVFLGGTRLKKFMESVEKVTGGIPAPMPSEEEGPGDANVVAGDETSEEERTAAVPREERQRSERVAKPREGRGRRREDEVFGELLSAGALFLEKLGRALETPEARKGDLPLPIERDAKTGRTYLKLPVPEPETVRRLAELLGGLIGRR